MFRIFKKQKWCVKSIALIGCLVGGSIQGATVTWDGGSTVNGNFTTGLNWVGDLAPGLSGGTATSGWSTNQDQAIFNSPITNGWGESLTPVSFSGIVNIKDIIFDTNAGNYVLGSTTANTLHLSGGGSIDLRSTLTSAALVTETMNSAMRLYDTASFINNSANGGGVNSGVFLFAGGITGVATLTLAGSNENNNLISGKLADGATLAGVAGKLSISKSDSGTWILSGTNTYSGTTAITGGTLQAKNVKALGTSAVSMNGGTLDLLTSVNDIYGNKIAVENGTIISNRNTVGVGVKHTLGELTVQNQSKLSVTAGANVNSGTATVAFTGAILKGNTTFEVLQTSPTVKTNLTIGGVSDEGNHFSFTKTGAGTLTIDQASSYTGATVILEGTTELGVSGAISFSDLTMGGGTLRIIDNTTNTAGILTLTASSIFDFGAGGAYSTISFTAGSGSWGSGLNVYNWQDLKDQFIVGSNGSALNLTQLANVNFYSDGGVTFLGHAKISSVGSVSVENFAAVPEPSSYGLVALGFLCLGCMFRRSSEKARAKAFRDDANF